MMLKRIFVFLLISVKPKLIVNNRTIPALALD